MKKEKEVPTPEVGRRLLGKNFLVTQRVQLSAKQRYADKTTGRRRRRKRRSEAARENGSNGKNDEEMRTTGKMAAQTSWWDLRAAGMGRHNAAVVQLAAWKKQEGRRGRMMSSAEGGASFLHLSTKPASWRGGLQVLEDLEVDVKVMGTCDEKREEEAKHWQCDSEVRGVEDKPWRNVERRNLEVKLPQLKEESLESAARSCKASTG